MKRNCLIVDDSRLIRKLVRDILEPLNFHCSEAENGEVALASCQKSMPELIMLDWNMPVMDGMAFLLQLRKVPGGDKPVVMFCTTENGMDRIQAAMAAGATDFIMKPFDKEIVRGKLIQNAILDEKS